MLIHPFLRLKILMLTGLILLACADTPVMGTIYGHVYDAASSEPISSAFVRCDGKTATSDSEGRYTIEGSFAPSASYTVTCYAPDYPEAKEIAKTGPDGKAEVDFYLRLEVEPEPQMNRPPVLTNLSPDKDSPQIAETTVSWLASAYDPEGDTIYYQFWLKGPSTGNTWNIVRDWSTSSTWTWSTGPADAGVYDIKAYVRDGKHAPATGYDSARGFEGYQLTQQMFPSFIRENSFSLIPEGLSFQYSTELDPSQTNSTVVSSIETDLNHFWIVSLDGSNYWKSVNIPLDRYARLLLFPSISGPLILEKHCPNGQVWMHNFGNVQANNPYRLWFYAEAPGTYLMKYRIGDHPYSDILTFTVSSGVQGDIMAI